MDLTKLLLIVDGQTEINSFKAFFQKNYYSSPSISKGPGNGIEYSVGCYVKNVLPTFKMKLNHNIRAFILIPDLEKRSTSCNSFSSKLKQELINELIVWNSSLTTEYLSKIIHICPPDIMFENWIISDIVNISKTGLIKDSTIQQKFDGRNGAKELDQMMHAKYEKTSHAHRLFKNLDVTIGIKNSPSFNAFYNCFEKLKNEHCI